MNLLTFKELMLIERKRSKMLTRWLDHFLASTSRRFVDHQLVGSSYMKEKSWEAFYPNFKELTVSDAIALLNSSDFDVAFKLDSFVLETLSRVFPNFNKKESEEYGRTYGTEGLLKTVYTLPVKDLYEHDSGLFKHIVKKDTTSSYSNTSSVSVEACLKDEFLNRKIEFLFVTDLDRVRFLWHQLPAELFADKLWKKSKNFVGHGELKTYFSLFETLVSFKKSPIKNITSIKELSTGDVIAAPQPDLVGQMVQAIWVEEAVNVAAPALNNLAVAAEEF